MTIKEAEDLCKMVNNYHPKTKEELINLIKKLIKKKGK